MAVSFLTWPLDRHYSRTDRAFTSTDRTSISDKREVINWSKMTTMKQASCEATHVHYVSVSAGLWLEYIKGLGVGVQLHPRLMTLQTDWPLGGLTAGGGGGWTGRGEHRGWWKGGKMELEEVKFRTEGRKVRAKGNSERKSAGGEDRGGYHSGPWMHPCGFGQSIPLRSLLVLVLGSGLKQWINTWPRLLTLPPSSGYPLQISKYVLSSLDTHTHTHTHSLTPTHTHTHTHTLGNTKSQSHMYTPSYLMYRE